MEDWLALLDAVQRLIPRGGSNARMRIAFVGEFANYSPKPNCDEEPGGRIQHNLRPFPSPTGPCWLRRLPPPAPRKNHQTTSGPRCSRLRHDTTTENHSQSMVSPRRTGIKPDPREPRVSDRTDPGDCQGWWTPYDAAHNHVLYSLSKSFTSTAVGFAVAEGKPSSPLASKFLRRTFVFPENEQKLEGNAHSTFLKHHLASSPITTPLFFHHVRQGHSPAFVPDSATDGR